MSSNQSVDGQTSDSSFRRVCVCVFAHIFPACAVECRRVFVCVCLMWWQWNGPISRAHKRTNRIAHPFRQPVTTRTTIMKTATTTTTALLLLSATSVAGLASPNPAIKVMAQGMSLLKPVFAAEAQLQAAVLGGSVDTDDVVAEIAANKKANKVLVYTYGLSPFSTEALSMLEDSGYEYTNIELGPEWFLLGGAESVTRVELSKEVESGATSLPKIFIGGNCIGGCAELAELVETGELDSTMKAAKVPKKGEAAAPAGLFSFLK